MSQSDLSVKEALEFGSISLKDVSDIAQKEARILLEYHLKKDHLWIMLNGTAKVQNTNGYKELIQRRKEFEPIEYICKNANFYGKEFYTDSRVLIPRPETEILVDRVLEYARTLKNPKIIEVGTGSGIISVMLALLLPQVKIQALDISKDALEVAKFNAKKYGVDTKIEFIYSDLFSNVKNIDVIDIIVSNPPYIASNEILEPNLDYEPSMALYGGLKGDELLQKILSFTFEHKIAYLACEMGYDQRDCIDKSVLDGYKVEFYKDLAGFDRGFVVQRKK